jgi:molybdopterin converting factor small subunit
MAVTVYIPTPFRRATNNRDRVEVAAADVVGLLDELERAYGGLRGLVRDEQGTVHHHVNIFVNSEAIDALEGLRTPLRDGDEVAIIPALAGGSASGRAAARRRRARSEASGEMGRGGASRRAAASRRPERREARPETTESAR